MPFWLDIFEDEAKEYLENHRTDSEVVWRAWMAASEVSKDGVEPAAALRMHASRIAFQAAQLGAQRKIAALPPSEPCLGFIPHMCVKAHLYGPERDSTSAELDWRLFPEFVPGEFIESLAKAKVEDQQDI